MQEVTGISLSSDESGLRVHIPMKMKKRGGRKEIIVPEGLRPVTRSRTVYQEALVVTLARAQRWKEMLESGMYGSIIEMATSIGVDRAYMSRLLRFTLLAPDIIEAIIEGREPSGFSLERLISSIPDDWDEQRRKYGFK